MRCDYFGRCGSCTLYDLDYEAQLQQKAEAIREMFGFGSTEPLEIVRSAPERFRTRAEFRIYHDYDRGTISYAMHGFAKGEIVPIAACGIVAAPIADRMQPMLEAISQNEMLRHRLYSVEFLSSSLGEVLVTLIYHKKIDEQWVAEARGLAENLGIDLIGRSRGVKLVVTKSYIDESVEIEGRAYRYRLYDTGFTQPNTGVNIRMIEWVRRQIPSDAGDLLELYCGHGNFTIPLADKFRKVLATEVSKRSIMSAKENAAANQTENIAFVRLSAEELTEALQQKRSFKRLEGVDLASYRFSHLFVDPPRAGLDADTRAFATRFENLIYISCNPLTLQRDLQQLLHHFEIEAFALFDQFAYTKHMECGVVLRKSV